MKKNKISLGIFFLSAASVAVWSCKKDSKSNSTGGSTPKQEVFAVDYNSVNTGGLASTFAPKTINNEQAALGRLLFYDTRLSVSGTISCGSCHKQNLGFADNVAHSQGFAQKTTTLNSMAINNPGFDFMYFWKGRASNLNDLALMPVSNHIEMGILDASEIANVIKNTPMYQEYFTNVFGSASEINNANIATSIAQFLNSIQGFDSRFDIASKNVDPMNFGVTDFSTFSPTENKGKNLFFGKYNCIACHGNNSQITQGWSSGSGNIGLDLSDAEDNTKSPWFKAPNLRNIELTAPYMHDGRFKTLEEVLNHYSQGIKNNPNLSWELRETDNKGNSVPKKFNISSEDKIALVAFLKTLTNRKLTTDKRFSNPFLN